MMPVSIVKYGDCEEIASFPDKEFLSAPKMDLPVQVAAQQLGLQL